MRHIKAKMVTSRRSSDNVAIMAMGAYNVRNMLEMNTIADSPGKPTTEKTGAKYDAIMVIIPKYCNRLTKKLIGKIILSNHQTVFADFGNAVFELVVMR